MRTPREYLQDVVGPQPIDILTETAEAGWAWIGDVVVGCVLTTTENWRDAVGGAYELLDNLDPERRVKAEQRWNVELHVVLADAAEPKQLRKIESDLRGTRKVVVSGSAPRQMPITDPHSRADTAATGATGVIEAGLDSVASGELRRALGVLLKKKCPSAEVNLLIEKLSEGHDHGDT
jgi:hypothetical protein